MKNDPIETPVQTPAHHNLSLRISLIIITLLLTLMVYLLYQYSLLKQELNQLTTAPSPASLPQTSPSPINIQTADWKTYTNSKYNFSLKYPPDFLLTEAKGKVEIYSPPHKCEAWPIGELQKIDASEVQIDFSVHTGNNFSQIWKQIFGFEFTPKNYDGTKVIGGKNAYYFFEGAEMVFGRTAYLIELSPTVALELNTWTPSAVSNCDKPLTEYTGITDEIISTLKFKDNLNGLQNFTSPKYKYSLLLPSEWKKFESNLAADLPDFRKGDYQFTVGVYPTSHKTIQNFLSESDKTSLTAWEGQPSVKVISTKLTKINNFSVVQRKEEFLAAGFAQPVVNTYFLIDGNIYSLQLRYLGIKPDPDASILIEYNDILSTFKFTD